MYEDLLREAGLSINEVRVYESLLMIKEAPIEGIAVKSKVHRRNVYDSIAKLLEKGLITEIFIEKKRYYRAINPSRLLDIISEKQHRLETALPELQKKFGSVEVKEEAYFYKGIEGFKNYLRDILETKETVYFIGAKAFWLDPRLQHFLPKFERERKRLGIGFVHIFDYDVKEQKPEILKLVGKPYKFLPKEYSSQTAVDIFGDYVVTFVGVKAGQLYENPIQFVLRSRRLADGYKKFFNFMWERLPFDY